MENIEIRVATLADKEPLLNFLRKHIRDNSSPVLTHLQFDEAEVNIVANQKIGNAFKNLDQIVSTLTVDKSTNQIVGCFLGSISDKSEVQYNDDQNMQKTEKLQLLRDFSRLMWSGVREFLPEGYQDAPYLFPHSALVVPEYRKLKLMTQMHEMVLEYAYTRFGCKFEVGIASNFIAISHVLSNGGRALRWVNFDDYYVHGKKVFDLGKDSPHKCESLMITNIEEWMNKRNVKERSKY